MGVVSCYPIHLLRPPKAPSAAARPQALQLTVLSATAHSVSLAWVAPTRDANLLRGFKVMVTEADGSVREVYEGVERSCEVGRLTPGAEYIFAVKASYAGGKFVWSESVAARTAAAPEKARAR